MTVFIWPGHLSAPRGGMSTGFRSYFGWRYGGLSAGSTVTPAPAAKKVGWPDTLRRRIPRKDLERLLALQKDNTFGRNWFAEFEAAQRQFAKDEAAAARAEAEKAIRMAARDVRRAAEKADEERHQLELQELAAGLQLARQASQIADAIEAAHWSAERARWLRKHLEDLEDDDEVEMLLLH